MSLIESIKNIFSLEPEEEKKEFENKMISMGEDDFFDLLTFPTDSSKKEMSEITYFTCIKLLSEALGKMPLKLFQETENGTEKRYNDNLKLLSLRPNAYMTATTFWSLLEFFRNHYGNAFVYIDSEFKKQGRYGGSYTIKGFYPMHPNDVTLLIDDKGIFKTDSSLFYQYINPDTGEMSIFKDSEVLHFKSFYTEDGIIGKPVKSVLKDEIEGQQAGSSYVNNLMKNGMTAKAVMQYTGTLDEQRVTQLQKKYSDRLSSPRNAGKIIPIPVGLTIQPLNMSLADADFSNLKKHSALQMASAFGLKPSQLNDYSNSKYASSESEALAFLDGFSYVLKGYEDELNSKLLTDRDFEDGYFYKFNEKSILRMDNKTQSEVLKNYVQGGIYTANEARDKLDLMHKDGGDELLVNGSYVKISEAGKAYGGRK